MPLVADAAAAVICFPRHRDAPRQRRHADAAADATRRIFPPPRYATRRLPRYVTLMRCAMPLRFDASEFSPPDVLLILRFYAARFCCSRARASAEPVPRADARRDNDNALQFAAACMPPQIRRRARRRRQRCAAPAAPPPRHAMRLPPMLERQMLSRHAAPPRHRRCRRSMRQRARGFAAAARCAAAASQSDTLMPPFARAPPMFLHVHFHLLRHDTPPLMPPAPAKRAAALLRRKRRRYAMTPVDKR